MAANSAARTTRFMHLVIPGTTSAAPTGAAASATSSVRSSGRRMRQAQSRSPAATKGAAASPRCARPFICCLGMSSGRSGRNQYAGENASAYWRPYAASFAPAETPGRVTGEPSPRSRAATSPGCSRRKRAYGRTARIRSGTPRRSVPRFLQ
jgi:hypothetical protein